MKNYKFILMSVFLFNLNISAGGNKAKQLQYAKEANFTNEELAFIQPLEQLKIGVCYNNPEALNLMGLEHLKGQVFPKDLMSAYHYFSVAAAHDNKDAYQNLLKLKKENFPNKSFEELNQLYLEDMAKRFKSESGKCFLQNLGISASNGDINAAYIIGYFYDYAPKNFEAQGLNQDYSRQCLQFAADNNHVFAQFALGKKFYEEKDYQKAEYYLNVAASARRPHAKALNLLGTIYSDTESGFYDLDNAANYFVRAISYGCFEANYGLGLVMFNKGNYRQAIHNLSEAKKLGFKVDELLSESHRVIGFNFRTQGELNKSFEEFRKSSDLGNIYSKFEVAYCLSNGIGVDADKQEAIKYYQELSELDDPYAIYYLGSLQVDVGQITAGLNNIAIAAEVADSNNIVQLIDYVYQTLEYFIENKKFTDTELSLVFGIYLKLENVEKAYSLVNKSNKTKEIFKALKLSKIELLRQSAQEKNKYSQFLYGLYLYLQYQEVKDEWLVVDAVNYLRKSLEANIFESFEFLYEISKKFKDVMSDDELQQCAQKVLENETNVTKTCLTKANEVLKKQKKEVEGQKSEIVKKEEYLEQSQRSEPEVKTPTNLTVSSRNVSKKSLKEFDLSDYHRYEKSELTDTESLEVALRLVNEEPVKKFGIKILKELSAKDDVYAKYHLVNVLLDDKQTVQEGLELFLEAERFCERSANQQELFKIGQELGVCDRVASLAKKGTKLASIYRGFSIFKRVYPGIDPIVNGSLSAEEKIRLSKEIKFAIEKMKEVIACLSAENIGNIKDQLARARLISGILYTELDNYEKAHECFALALKDGLSESRNYLRQVKYLWGYSLLNKPSANPKKTFDKGMALLREAADLGDFDSQKYLGINLADSVDLKCGVTLKENINEAEVYLKQALKQNPQDVDIKITLTLVHYLSGNLNKARALCKEFGEDLKVKIYNYAVDILSGEWGMGSKAYEKGMRYLKMSADFGCETAQSELARLVSANIKLKCGCETKKDFELSEKYARMALENKNSTTFIADLDRLVFLLVDKDNTIEAFDLLRKIIGHKNIDDISLDELNNEKICSALHIQGILFMKLNLINEALKCFEKCAKKNYFFSESLLSAIYFSGKGIQKDLQRSTLWLIQAIRHGALVDGEFKCQNAKSMVELLTNEFKDKRDLPQSRFLNSLISELEQRGYKEKK